MPRGRTFLAEWDALSGKMVREFDAGGYVISCAYSRDGQKLAASMRGGSMRARVWSALSGSLLHKLGPGSTSGLQHPLAFSPDSRFLITAVGDGSNDLRLWNSETGTSRIPFALLYSMYASMF